METFVEDLIQVLLGGGLVFIIGLLTWYTQRRTARTQARQADQVHELGLTDRWENWANQLEKRVEAAEASVKEVRGLFNIALVHIRDLRDLIVSLGGVLPPLPAALVHLIPLNKPHGDEDLTDTVPTNHKESK